MDMTGEKLILADRDAVWSALNNTEILKACIPGCESLEALSPTQMKALAAVKLGPIAAKFTGDVTLSELTPPSSYMISGEGRGGVAGFAKGSAQVHLVQRDDGTLLSYSVSAQIGGKIAQLGARLIDATAKSMADQFFVKFAAAVEQPPAATLENTASRQGPNPAVAPAPSNPAPSQPIKGKVLTGIALVVVLACAAFWYLH